MALDQIHRPVGLVEELRLGAGVLGRRGGDVEGAVPVVSTKITANSASPWSNST